MISASDPRVIAFLAVVGIVSILLVRRGFVKIPDLRTGETWRDPLRMVIGLGGGIFGVAFAGLLYLALTTARDPHAQFDMVADPIRYASLAVGVVFLVFVLFAVLPALLNSLERFGFVPYVAARHVRASKSGFLTIISVLSISGVSVSSCALCSVTSIMGGFGYDLKQKILRNYAHIVVDSGASGGFTDWEEVVDRIRLGLGPNGAATPVVAGDAMSSSAIGEAAALEILDWNRGTFEPCSAGWPSEFSISKPWQANTTVSAARSHAVSGAEAPGTSKRPQASAKAPTSRTSGSSLATVRLVQTRADSRSPDATTAASRVTSSAGAIRARGPSTPSCDSVARASPDVTAAVLKNALT